MKTPEQVKLLEYSVFPKETFKRTFRDNIVNYCQQSISCTAQDEIDWDLNSQRAKSFSGDTIVVFNGQIYVIDNPQQKVYTKDFLIGSVNEGYKAGNVLFSKDGHIRSIRGFDSSDFHKGDGLSIRESRDLSLLFTGLENTFEDIEKLSSTKNKRAYFFMPRSNSRYQKQIRKPVFFESNDRIIINSSGWPNTQHG